MPQFMAMRWRYCAKAQCRAAEAGAARSRGRRTMTLGFASVGERHGAHAFFQHRATPRKRYYQRTRMNRIVVSSRRLQ